MKNKKIVISHEIWAQLNEIKEVLTKKNPDQPFQWSETLDYILTEFQRHQQFPQSSIPTPGVKSPLQPMKLPNSPGLEQSKHLGDSSLEIPIAPSKKPVKIEINSRDLKILTHKETIDTKYILIECNMCGSKPILMPVPKKIVLEATEPVVDVSYIHGNPEHVVVAQLDHDFQVRRRRVSEVVYEKDYK
ncbi:MAG: hypothetical protein E4G98_01375 [Promethearchaeota archaeon]|nr:MAG: hypothetical protein E4G98_01375 [Candidatus Lokiarchaeota archaeon]